MEALAKEAKGWQRDILPFLPLRIRNGLMSMTAPLSEHLEEIRVRAERPVQLLFDEKELFLSTNGTVLNIEKAICATMDECKQLLDNISFHSLYALEQELKNGFITLPGGYRVGLTGKVNLEGGRIKLISAVASFNIRIARQRLGSADKLMPYILDSNRLPMPTLIVSPPGFGKTTLLRDTARQLSNGLNGAKPMKVSIADERSEIAGSWLGVPQNDVGIRSDILDGCPKAEAISLLLRAMSPQVIVTDEIGREEDMQSLLDASNAGVVLIASAHGNGMEDILSRPLLQTAVAKKLFKRYVILSRSLGVGTIEEVLDDNLQKISGTQIR